MKQHSGRLPVPWRHGESVSIASEFAWPVSPGLCRSFTASLWFALFCTSALHAMVDAQELQPILYESGCRNVAAELDVDLGHPWRPPFGVERVGEPLSVHVKLNGGQSVELREYELIAYRDGKEIERHNLTFQQHPATRVQKIDPAGKGFFFGNVQLASIPDELGLEVACIAQDRFEEVVRRRIDWPDFEADAVARPNRQINPVDLGAILVPHDWLLLAAGQTAKIDVAAISRSVDIPNARVSAWFEGGASLEVSMPLAAAQLATKTLELPLRQHGNQSVLHVRVVDGIRQLWKKEIRTMIVQAPLVRPPEFGAVRTKLRYDGNVPVNDPDTGAELPAIDYDAAWDASLDDVVVFLPNGSRFVFWRGSNYVPFWAGLHNTGLSYEWAENLSQPIRHVDGSVDFPEPIFDGELRYGSVDIVESTSSRIHVRWRYQSTDIKYRVWGDQTIEDFYFYPDGFGTRVVTLATTEGATYQLSEFIVLLPQGAYPFEVLPRHMVDLLFLDGRKASLTFPIETDDEWPVGERVRPFTDPTNVPVLYRVFINKDEPSAAIYFSPEDRNAPFAQWPMYDRAQRVTPVYWGGHWPLQRGKWTKWGIGDDIYSGPSHSSILAWPWVTLPEPVLTSEYDMLDSLGHSQTVKLRRWAWLIANTKASDKELLGWAQSYSKPPSLELVGASTDLPSYSPERRAIRLIVKSDLVKIRLKPETRAINPVFELQGALQSLESVVLDGQELPGGSYEWDGGTLWIKADIDSSGGTIVLRFRSPAN